MSQDLSLAVRIAQDLIRRPSVTPKEAGALETLERYLRASGFSVERVTFTEAGADDVENLFATIGSGAPHFVFAGHTDVVPAGDETSWSHPPFSGEIVDGNIFGRGAADMKGGVAAFAAAAHAFTQTNGGNFSGTISFLITGDEEGPAVNGTVKLLQWAKERGHVFDACIVGEPTNPERLGDAIKVGRRGSLSGVITSTGVQGHVAYPHLARNPIPQMLPLLTALSQLRLDEGNERFQPSNLEITSIDVGNGATNVIPAKVTAKFNIRYNDTWSLQELKRKITDTLQEAADGVLDWSLEFMPDASESFLTHDETLINSLSAAIRAETGREPELSTGGGTSDARFIKNYCAVVEFGLVGQTMHQIDEHVAVADIDKLTRIYELFLDNYFKK